MSERGLAIAKSRPFHSSISNHPLHLQAGDDLIDHFRNAHIGAIDDVRVPGHHQRSNLARGIRPVARQDLIPLTLRHAPAQPHLRRRIDVKFVGRLGKNDGANISTLNHHVASARTTPHLFDQNFPDPRNTADEGDCGIHVIVMKMVGGIETVDANAGLVLGEVDLDSG